MSEESTSATTTTTTVIEDALENIEPTVTAIYEWLYDFFTDQGWTEGADYLKIGYDWYIADFAAVAEQVLSITVLTIYYFIFQFVMTFWGLVPSRFQLLIMQLEEFDPNEYDD